MGFSPHGKTKLPSLQYQEVGFKADLNVKPGIPAFSGAKINYKRDGKLFLTVRLDDPAIVDVATKPEKWGFFQFPNIYRSLDNAVVITWNMSAYDVTSYGKGGNGQAVSRDGGKSWSPSKGKPPVGGGLLLPAGDLISIATPKTPDTAELKLTKPVGMSKEAYGRNFVYYKLSELPAKLQGVYLNRLVNGETKWRSEHNLLDDPQAVRYTDSGLFPVVWWGVCI